MNLKGTQTEQNLLKAFAGESQARNRYSYFAAIAKNEGFEQNNDMLKAFFSYYSKSPYVPGTNKKRISQVTSDKEPPLLIAMRKRLENYFR